jgi:hypothetical protein
MMKGEVVFAAIIVAVLAYIGYLGFRAGSSRPVIAAEYYENPSEDLGTRASLSKLKLVCLHGTQYWFSEGSYNQTTLTPRYVTSKYSSDFSVADCPIERHMMEVNP